MCASWEPPLLCDVIRLRLHEVRKMFLVFCCAFSSWRSVISESWTQIKSISKHWLSNSKSCYELSHRDPLGFRSEMSECPWTHHSSLAPQRQEVKWNKHRRERRQYKLWLVTSLSALGRRLTSWVEVAFPRMHLWVFGGQSLVGPAEPLGWENHPVTQTRKLGQQLLRARREDHVVTTERERIQNNNNDQLR